MKLHHGITVVLSLVLFSSIGAANLEGISLHWDNWETFNEPITCETDNTDRCVEGDEADITNDFIDLEISSGRNGFCGTAGVKKQVTLPDPDENLGLALTPHSAFVDYHAEPAGLKIVNESGDSEWLIQFTSEGGEKLNFTADRGYFWGSSDDRYANINQYKGETVTLKLMIQGQNGTYCNMQDREQSLDISTVSIVSGLENGGFEANPETESDMASFFTYDSVWTNISDTEIETKEIQHDEFDISTGMDDNGVVCGDAGKQQFAYIPKGETVEMVFEASATLDEDAGKVGIFEGRGDGMRALYEFESDDLGSSYEMKERRVDVSNYAGEYLPIMVGVFNNQEPPCDPIREHYDNINREIEDMRQAINQANEEGSNLEADEVEWFMWDLENILEDVDSSDVLNNDQKEDLRYDITRMNQSLNTLNDSLENPDINEVDTIERRWIQFKTTYGLVERPSTDDMDAEMKVKSIDFVTSGGEDEDNQPPTAGIDANLFAGSTVTVDASESSDPDDPLGDLETRWDWTNDGTWDTDWNSSRTAEHNYQEDVGNEVTIKGQVRDPSGATDSAITSVTLSGDEGGGDEEGITFEGDLWASVKLSSSVSGSDIPDACGDSPTAYNGDSEGLNFASIAADGNTLSAGTWLIKMDSQCTVDLPTTDEPDTGTIQSTGNWTSGYVGDTLNGSDLPEQCGTPVAYSGTNDGDLGFNSLATDNNQIDEGAYLFATDGECSFSLPGADGEGNNQGDNNQGDENQGEVSTQQAWCTDNDKGDAMRDTCVTESQALAEGGILYTAEDGTTIENTCQEEKGFVCEQ